MKENRSNRRNRGSAVIEFTLLTPIFLGCIYFYIMLFLFFIGNGKKMEEISNYAYVAEERKQEYGEGILGNVQIQKEGKLRVIRVEEQGKLFILRLEIRTDENDPVENLRRWQIVTDTFQ